MTELIVFDSALHGRDQAPIKGERESPLQDNPNYTEGRACNCPRHKKQGNL